MEDLEAFARRLRALRPWLGQLVVVGGWAHRLHRLHPLAEAPNHPPLRTRDTDLAFETNAIFVGDVREALLGAGFTEEVRRIETVAGALFADVSDTIREPARIPQNRRLAPQDVRQACAYGLVEILGLDRTAR